MVIQVRRSLQLSQSKQQERINFLRLGKHHIEKEEMRHENRVIVYNTWQEELHSDLASMERKDQELAEACVEVRMLYRELDDAAPLRIE